MSMVEITDLNDDQAKEVLEQLGALVTADAENCIGWATQNKQGSLSRKTLVSLWFITGTS